MCIINMEQTERRLSSVISPYGIYMRSHDVFCKHVYPTYAVLQQRVDGRRIVNDGELDGRHHCAASQRRTCRETPSDAEISQPSVVLLKGSELLGRLT